MQQVVGGPFGLADYAIAFRGGITGDLCQCFSSQVHLSNLCLHVAMDCSIETRNGQSRAKPAQREWGKNWFACWVLPMLFLPATLMGKEQTTVAKCEICGKGPTAGCNVSHSHVRTKRVWNTNLQKVKTNINNLSLIHISEPTRLGMISYAV